MINRIILALTLTIALCGCTKDQAPSLTLELAQIDSTARLILLGRELRTDMLLKHGEEPIIVLHPDTSLYQSAYLLPQSGQSGEYFTLVDGLWQKSEPRVEVDTIPKTFYNISGQDASGKYQSLAVTSSRERLVVVFSDISLRTHTEAEVRALRKRYSPDSLRFVYMMLTPSDSVARKRIKADSLTGVVFSDTLGVVSQFRQSYGIARKSGVSCFVIDSLGKQDKRR